MSHTTRPGKQLWRYCLAFWPALALAPGLSAQTTDKQETPDAQDNSAIQRQETITVYGTTNPLPVFDYPGQVTAIDRETIDDLVASTISDILRDVPGLDFSGGPRRTGEVPGIRGLSGQNVLVLLDGARQSFTSAHDGRFFIDPELVGTVEIVRGPASALYGSGVAGGVLAFESVKAADLLKNGETSGGRIRLGYQSANKETLAAITAFTRQGAFDGLASFGIRRSGDIALGSGIDLPSDDKIQSALVKGGYTLTDSLSVEGSWQHFTNTAIEPNNGQGVLGSGSGTLDRDVKKDIKTDTFRLGLTFNPADNDWINLGLTAYQTASRVDEFDATVPRLTIRDIKTTGFSVRNVSQLTNGSVETLFTLGGDWYRDKQTGRDDQTADGTRQGVPNGTSEFTGIFAQLESRIATPAGEFLLIPGVRYDSFKSTSTAISNRKNSDNTVSPRFAVSLEPAGTPWLRLFGSYAKGFRAPSINELYLDGTHFTVPHPVLFNAQKRSFVFTSNNFVANPDLVPETTQTREVGIGFDFGGLATSGDRLQAKISYYDTDTKNLINLSVKAKPDPTCFAPPAFQPCTFGTTESANIDRGEIKGWESDIRYDSKRLFGQIGWSRVDGTNPSNGADLGSLTPDRLSLRFGVKVPEWQTQFAVRVQVADSFTRRTADSKGVLSVAETRSGYTVTDIHASWRPKSVPGLRLDFGVDNVFDKNYERVFAGVSEPGRNVKITASWQFGQ